MIDNPYSLLYILSVLMFGVFVTLLMHSLIFGSNSIAQKFEAYRRKWIGRVTVFDIPPWVIHLPIIQIVAVLLFLIAAWILREPKFLAASFVCLTLPFLLLKRAEKKRRRRFEDDLDGFLVALADSLTAVPNLTEALSTLRPNLMPPIRDEVSRALAEVRLGQTVDDALIGMAARVKMTGLDAAVGAVVLSRQVGGDLPKTLRRIAETVREMARLEGVVQSKTAEGRTQAFVIGILPPGLVLYFEKINPEWLAPMWSDPIGWVLFGAAAVAEIVALALIRKIMAVDI